MTHSPDDILQKHKNHKPQANVALRFVVFLCPFVPAPMRRSTSPTGATYFSWKMTVTVEPTDTGSPLSSVGEYFHCFTARTASSTSSG